MGIVDTRLREMRNAYGLSQAEAARLIDHPLSTYIKWEGGHAPYHDRVLKNFKLRYESYVADKETRLT